MITVIPKRERVTDTIFMSARVLKDRATSSPLQDGLAENWIKKRRQSAHPESQVNQGIFFKKAFAYRLAKSGMVPGTFALTLVTGDD